MKLSRWWMKVGDATKKTLNSQLRCWLVKSSMAISCLRRRSYRWTRQLSCCARVTLPQRRTSSMSYSGTRTSVLSKLSPRRARWSLTTSFSSWYTSCLWQRTTRWRGIWPSIDALSLTRTISIHSRAAVLDLVETRLAVDSQAMSVALCQVERPSKSHQVAQCHSAMDAKVIRRTSLVLRTSVDEVMLY